MILERMKEQHRDAVAAMMTDFYASDAVDSNGSPEIFDADISACLSDNPYLEGYVFTEDGFACGYAMLAKSFSTEFGKPCVWVEDLYFRPEYRSRGGASLFFDFLKTTYPNAVYRLEAEKENGHAVHVYEKQGFHFLPYTEMICGDRNS